MHCALPAPWQHGHVSLAFTKRAWVLWTEEAPAPHFVNLPAVQCCRHVRSLAGEGWCVEYSLSQDAMLLCSHVEQVPSQFEEPVCICMFEVGIHDYMTGTLGLLALAVWVGSVALAGTPQRLLYNAVRCGLSANYLVCSAVRLCREFVTGSIVSILLDQHTQFGKVPYVPASLLEGGGLHILLVLRRVATVCHRFFGPWHSARFPSVFKLMPLNRLPASARRVIPHCCATPAALHCSQTWYGAQLYFLSWD